MKENRHHHAVRLICSMKSRGIRRTLTLNEAARLTRLEQIANELPWSLEDLEIYRRVFELNGIEILPIPDRL